MRKITILVLAVVFSMSANAGIIYVPANSTDNVKSGNITNGKTVTNFDVQTILALTPSKVQEMTGRKMTFVQKIALKAAQKNLKKELNSSKKLDTKNKSQMLRLWLIFAVIAIVASIIGVFVPFVWVISSLAWLASLIFFILWLIALSA